MNVYEKLMQVQSQLKAPKNQFNSFGKYKYRSCEDILEGLKPILANIKAIVTLSDAIEQIGDRFYLKATATFTDVEKGEKIDVSALAREDETKKGMDLAQVTGSVSSYARKYALNGLFCIDDTKDSDTTNQGDTPRTNPNPHSDTSKPSNTNTPPLEKNKLETLRNKLKLKGITEAYIVKLQKKKLENFTVEEYIKYMDWLEKKEDKK